MSLVETNDPSEFWSCLRLPSRAWRRKLFVGREREKAYQVNPPLCAPEEPKPVQRVVPLVKREDIEFIGPPDLSRREDEQQLEWIKRWISHNHRISVKDLESQSRHRKLTAARKEYYYVAAMTTNFSLACIGKYCGKRGHNPVLKGANRHAEEKGLTAPSWANRPKEGSET